LDPLLFVTHLQHPQQIGGADRTRVRFCATPAMFMTTILRAFVYLAAALQAVIVGMFAVVALDGDDWGIARALTLLLAIPLITLTGGALILTVRGYPHWASAITLLSIVLMWLAWLQA
jgi:hypothetical protein